jgi:hypothetical protein
LVLLAFRIVALGIGPTLKGEIMSTVASDERVEPAPEVLDDLTGQRK